MQLTHLKKMCREGFSSVGCKKRVNRLPTRKAYNNVNTALFPFRLKLYLIYLFKFLLLIDNKVKYSLESNIFELSPCWGFSHRVYPLSTPKFLKNAKFISCWLLLISMIIIFCIFWAISDLDWGNLVSNLVAVINGS